MRRYSIVALAVLIVVLLAVGIRAIEQAADREAAHTAFMSDEVEVIVATIAFGMGIDRVAMLKYGIPDLRDMFASDTRWLAHYGFSAFAAPNPASGLS